MNIPYRTRRVLHNLSIIALALVLVGVFVWAVWMLWLDRYVIYSRDGATIDFNASAENLSGEVAVPPAEEETIAIYYNEGENAISASSELGQVYGYYLDTAILQQQDLAEVRKNIESLPAGSTVMIEVKNIYGDFHYTSAIGPESTEVNISEVDSLISYLRTSGIYTIAEVSAFRDYYYGLHNDTYGIPHIDGGYLYADEEYCYWLNPDSAGTMNYLINIVAELKGLGFDEVVFNEFRFPDSEEILYEGDKAESLSKAAATLAASCASETFAVSFVTDLESFTLPTGRTRAYIDSVPASQAKLYAERSGFEDPATYLIFLTEAKDTRYDEYGVLRPITAGKFDEEKD